MLIKPVKKIRAILPVIVVLFLVTTIVSIRSHSSPSRFLADHKIDSSKWNLNVISKLRDGTFASSSSADEVITVDDVEATALAYIHEDDEEEDDSVAAHNVEAILSDFEFEDDGEVSTLVTGTDYREIFSISTRDRKYFPIVTGGNAIFNPSIIPHPMRYDLWIVVAQHQDNEEDMSAQLICSAGFLNEALVCSAEPTTMPVEPSINGQCEGELAFHNMRPGVRDAHMFSGPRGPFLVYGSQSHYTCMGVWLQDARMLLDDFLLEQETLTDLFKQPTEIRRPPPIKGVEKNFFLFWDSQGKPYVHHDIYPKRIFAALDFDGAVSEDLAPEAAHIDDVCMTKYMPKLAPSEESIGQATNSLAITLCNRGMCIPDDKNTLIMTIIQHKTNKASHSISEPYVMLFNQTAPFEMHAISQRPLWIHGRAPLTADTHAKKYEKPENEIPWDHTESFQITSMSWKTHGQRYHGYLDDPILLAFGIEETRAGAIDVMAADLVQDLGLCDY